MGCGKVAARQEVVMRKACLLVVILAAACGKEAPAPVERARPVTVLELVELDPTRMLSMTGSAEPFREEQVAFEVAGRVEFIVNLGTEVEGAQLDGAGNTVAKGDLIARLDTNRYELELQALRAQVRAQRKVLEAQRIEIDQVLKADVQASENEVKAAVAALKLARSNLVRAKQLFERGAGTEQDVDTNQKNLDTAIAAEQQAQAALRARRATIVFRTAQAEGTEAQISQLIEQEKQARRNLDDCELRAPFAGRITALYEARGAVVTAGAPIVRLTMMDPIQVSVAVSADDDREIFQGTTAEIVPHSRTPRSGRLPALSGMVVDKAAVADAATRTFRIDLVTRNQRIHARDINPELKDLPVVERSLPAIRRYHGEPGRLFVGRECIVAENGAHYVLRLPIRFGEPITDMMVSKHVPERVPVTPGDESTQIALWRFRALDRSDGLVEGDFLIMIPEENGRPIPDPYGRYKDGIAMANYIWRVRPGELVSVSLSTRRLPRGLYVPVEAIATLNEQRFVFVVEKGTARRVGVTVHESIRDKRRIEGEGLAAGARIVVRGVHYVRDGETVAVVGKEQAK
jgi:multidrug resistance efflux pump